MKNPVKTQKPSSQKGPKAYNKRTQTLTLIERERWRKLLPEIGWELWAFSTLAEESKQLPIGRGRADQRKNGKLEVDESDEERKRNWVIEIEGKVCKNLKERERERERKVGVPIWELRLSGKGRIWRLEWVLSIWCNSNLQVIARHVHCPQNSTYSC